ADGPVYATFDFTDISSVKIKSGDAVLHTQNTGKYINIFAAGDFKAGDVVTFQADVEEQKSGNGTIYVYQINKEVFEKGYEKLKSGGLNVTDYDDTHISGTITAAEDCVMYTSIPYDGGWKAYVDGKKTEVKSMKDAFVCVPLSAGEHTIELKYCPPGFVPGLVISIVSVAMLVLLWIYEPKLKKVFSTKSKTVPETSEEIPEDNEDNGAEENEES
ncbi:MAG: YfhO family protein, partial [Porcipelethomonas sp.]